MRLAARPIARLFATDDSSAQRSNA